MDDLFSFKTLFTPRLIQIVFWVGTASMVIPSFFAMISYSFWTGLIGVIAAPVLMRVTCETVLVLFRINDTLIEIKKLQENQ